MSDIVVYGIPGSPYLRSTLLGLHGKGAGYRLAVVGREIAVRSAEHLQRHPFARPSMQASEVERLKQAA